MVQQITWQNVNAPDLTGAADILARAGGAFSEVGNGIGAKLQDFRKQQMVNRSAAAFPMLAGINSGGNVDSILGQVANTVKPQDMTPDLQQAMLNARGLGVGYDTSRANIGLTGANTQSVSHAMGRADQTQNRTVAQEDQAAGMAGDIARLHQDAVSGQYGVNNPNISPEFRAQIPHIQPGESGGDYNKLFDSAEAAGGAFEGVKVTDMTVDQALDFANPSGPYGQYVKANNKGVTSTPMGGFQVIGSTLADAKRGLGLTGKEVMTPALQDMIGQWIYQTQGTGAWVGYNANAPKPTSGPSLADIAARPGNLQPPSFFTGQQDANHTAERAAMGESQTDYAFSRAENTRVLEEGAARKAAIVDRQANISMEEIMKGVGPVGTGGGDPARQARDVILAQDLPPTLRDAMMAKIPEFVGKNEGSYTPPVAPLQNETVAAGLSQLGIANGEQPPEIQAMIAAGMIADPSKPGADAIAPVGSLSVTDEANKLAETTATLGGQIASAATSGQVPQGVGGKNSEVIASSADVTRIVQEIYDAHNGQLPKSIITGMISQSMRGGSARGMFLRDNILYLDKGALEQNLSTVDTEAKRQQLGETFRQKTSTMARAKMLGENDATIRNALEFWSNKDTPEAQAKVTELSANLKSVDDALAAIVSKSAEDHAAKPDPKAVTPERQMVQDAADRASGATKAYNKKAIQDGESIPTPSGNTVDPQSSGFDQALNRTLRFKEISDTMSEIKRSLDRSGAGGVNAVLGSVVDFFSAEGQAKVNQSDRKQVNEVKDWFNTDAAVQLFSENPSLLTQAKENPVGFYQENVIGQRPADGPRSNAQPVKSPVDTILQSNAAPTVDAPAVVPPPVASGSSNQMKVYPKNEDAQPKPGYRMKTYPKANVAPTYTR